MITDAYLIDEFVKDGTDICFVICLVAKDGQKDAYFCRMIAPNTFYAYERILLTPNVEMDDFLKMSKKLKGVRVYASEKTQKSEMR